MLLKFFLLTSPLHLSALGKSPPRASSFPPISPSDRALYGSLLEDKNPPTSPHSAQDVDVTFVKGKLKFTPVKPPLTRQKAKLPSAFDARLRWPQCKSIREIYFLKKCRADWAASVVAVLTDRLCISTNGTDNFQFSAEELISCCIACRSAPEDRCAGGVAAEGLIYWVSHGIVSGGQFKSRLGCKPYSVRSMYDMKSSCQHDCVNKFFKGTYENDLKTGTGFRVVLGGEEFIKKNIYESGPVIGMMQVNTGFLNFTEGIYEINLEEEPLGIITIKILGWGFLNGTNYWIVATPLADFFQDSGGFMKIRRGKNSGWIESKVMIPRMSSTINKKKSEEKLDTKKNSSCEKQRYTVSFLAIFVFFCSCYLMFI